MKDEQLQVIKSLSVMRDKVLENIVSAIKTDKSFLLIQSGELIDLTSNNQISIYLDLLDEVTLRLKEQIEKAR